MGLFSKADPGRVNELVDQRSDLLKEIENLRVELAEVKHKKKLEEEDLKHLVRIKEEKLELDFQKREIERERETEETIRGIREDYQKKLESRLEEEVTRIQEMYNQILKRLPNVNVEMTGEV